MEYQQVMRRSPAPLPLHGTVNGGSLYAAMGLPRRPLAAVPAPIPRRSLTTPRFVTTAEIVKRLGVTTLAVNKWREGSSLREPLKCLTTRLGRANRVLIREDVLTAWLGMHRPDLLEVWRS